MTFYEYLRRRFQLDPPLKDWIHCATPQRTYKEWCAHYHVPLDLSPVYSVKFDRDDRLLKFWDWIVFYEFISEFKYEKTEPLLEVPPDPKHPWDITCDYLRDEFKLIIKRDIRKSKRIDAIKSAIALKTEHITAKQRKVQYIQHVKIRLSRQEEEMVGYKEALRKRIRVDEYNRSADAKNKAILMKNQHQREVERLVFGMISSCRNDYMKRNTAKKPRLYS